MSISETESSAPLKEVVIPSDLRSAKETERGILRDVRASGFDADHAFAIKLALEEALTNAIKHGNRCDADKKVVVRYGITPKRVGILWDASLSRDEADHARELELLRAWLDTFGPRGVTIDVTVFADAPLAPVPFLLPGGTESLNAAASATALLYEAARQRGGRV